ncbi:MAG: hypothetical protein COB35_08615 [Gammaproteobacteria bacterium]|nr:MAG: hypothetical protein COB35_08615 [Gammaproteobacteria bacterium]
MKNVLIFILFSILLLSFNSTFVHATENSTSENSAPKNSTTQNTTSKTASKKEVTRVEKLKALLAENQAQDKNGKQAVIHLNAKIVELKDSTGLVYVGAKVNKAELSAYLQQMENLLGTKQFKLFRANQIARDQYNFHVTLINPYEYQTIKQPIKLGQSIRLTLQGLGKVAINNANKKANSPQKNASSYFVVTSSNDGQFFRQQHLLKAKDFHITLGFNPHDIYNMSKGKERLVK